jgi:hypothetical protein
MEGIIMENIEVENVTKNDVVEGMVFSEERKRISIKKYVTCRRCGKEYLYFKDEPIKGGRIVPLLHEQDGSVHDCPMSEYNLKKRMKDDESKKLDTLPVPTYRVREEVLNGARKEITKKKRTRRSFKDQVNEMKKICQERTKTRKQLYKFLRKNQNELLAQTNLFNIILPNQERKKSKSIPDSTLISLCERAIEYLESRE